VSASLALPGIEDLEQWEDLMATIGMKATLRDWVEDAACGPRPIDDLKWFPSKEAAGQGSTPSLSPRVQAALALCANCPVMEKCLRYGLVTDSEGVWGGTFQWERRAALESGDEDEAMSILQGLAERRAQSWGWARMYERRSA
jgi:hypothetical protein